MALALLTYNPKDAAFNVSAPPPDGDAAKNWIVPVGAYSAAFFFQIFGFSPFLSAGPAGGATDRYVLIGKVEQLGIPQMAQDRWQAWGEDGKHNLMRRGVEESRLSGRKPVAPQSIGKGEVLNEPPKTIRMADESNIFKGRTEAEEDDEKETSHKTPIVVLNREMEKAAARKASDPKFPKVSPNYKLPSPSLLREGERSQKLDEGELKLRARAIEAKCLEFHVQGRVSQINPGPVVTTSEFKPDAGMKNTRLIGLTEGLCLTLHTEPILIERIA